MARRGRGNVLDRRIQRRIISMLTTRNYDESVINERPWHWSIMEVAHENSVDPKTVRKVMREWLKEYWDKIRKAETRKARQRNARREEGAPTQAKRLGEPKLYQLEIPRSTDVQDPSSD